MAQQAENTRDSVRDVLATTARELVDAAAERLVAVGLDAAELDPGRCRQVTGELLHRMRATGRVGHHTEVGLREDKCFGALRDFGVILTRLRERC